MLRMFCPPYCGQSAAESESVESARTVVNVVSFIFKA